MQLCYTYETICILNSLNVNRDKTEKLMETKTHFGGGVVNVSKAWWLAFIHVKVGSYFKVA